jgi:hypothetical protein
MDRFNILLGHIKKQEVIINKLFVEVKDLDLDQWELQYVFAMKVQQLYTAIEDLMKSVAINFENSIEDYKKYHYELIRVLSLDIPDVRPALLSTESLKILDKLRSFRHFVRHGYNYELDKDELKLIQDKLIHSFELVQKDIIVFSDFTKSLIDGREI